ncbi:hypothetical protein B2G71_23455 [Novosphingobium sp. PC22D]|uniref:asparagine synthetase B family protein n=1 Tax=Novosphingobium sp. PC22D TaxID=1962403 RepID=UPI000BEFCF75|nr:asparagine synthase-related protein [Novosphingobium sp. PC22D]PEQ10233.1 hypothetical protein B2G71_23455 [Novosphingobium sp. PC22D]
MSAIHGIVRFDGASADADTLDRMARTLAHRGPDGSDRLALDAVGFGHCLMRVNVEDFHEAQPIWEDGLLIVADMRLDNREELAEALGIADEALGAISDSALLARAWRHWGEDCVERLLGDFVFAVHDTRTKQSWLVRDPMGQRALFYHHGEGFLAFASEVKALWAIEGVPRKLSRAWIGRMLLHPVAAPREDTAFEEIFALPGGTALRFEVGGAMTRRRYWRPRPAARHEGLDEAYYVKTLRDTLEEVVACRVRRLIHPPALMFSGGFDSGTIAALAGPYAAAKGHRVIAITSVLPPGEQRLLRNARAAVDAFADRADLDIRYYDNAGDDYFDTVEESFAATEDVSGTSRVRTAMHRIAREGGARLIMDGHGGDYTVNVNAPTMLGRILLRGHFRRFLRELRARKRFTGRSLASLVYRDVLSVLIPERYRHGMARLARGGKPLWRTRMSRDEFAAEMIRQGFVNPGRLRNPFGYKRWRKRWLHLLEVGIFEAAGYSRRAAAAGLDFTRPFLDPRVVEFALAIPEAYQFRDGRERYLSRKAFADILPEKLISRRPGNDQEEPDLFRMASSAPTVLCDLAATNGGGSAARYIDFDKLAKALDDLDETSIEDHRRLLLAARALIVARFVNWAEQDNAPAEVHGASDAGQEP